MEIFKLVKYFQSLKALLRKRAYFTTPSHCFGSFKIKTTQKLLGNKIFKSDFSEIVSCKKCLNPETALLNSQIEATEIYETKRTFYLANGSTSGIVASMLSVLKSEDEVLIARNCHKSVYSGLVLTNAKPIWLLPSFNKDWSIYDAINANEIEKQLEKNKNIKAIIITNPTYEGILSDVEKIVKIAKKYNVISIIDEAHGALWKFDRTLGVSGIDVDADFCIQSLHKTAGALNPSALLHVSKQSKVEINEVQKALKLISTTSPSFPLMLNIENTINFLNSQEGKKEIAKLVENIQNFKKSLSSQKNIEIFSKNNDITKILIKIKGITGLELSEILSERFNIEDELANQKSVLFLTGIGTTKKRLNRLKKALLKIAKEKELENHCEFETTSQPQPQVKFAPSVLRLAKSIDKKKDEAVGKIANQLVVPYPPGIAVLMPGEIVQKWHAQNIEDETIAVLDFD